MTRERQVSSFAEGEGAQGPSQARIPSRTWPGSRATPTSYSCVASRPTSGWRRRAWLRGCLLAPSAVAAVILLAEWRRRLIRQPNRWARD